MTALILVATAEFGLRRHYSDISQITGVAPWQTAEWEGLAYHWDVYHPSYGWSNLPGYRSDERIPFRVTINRQGLRAGREYSIQPSSGVSRIAVFGDSCVFGEEVDDGQTVTDHLEQFLLETEALNYGVRGFGLGQMLLRLEQEGLDLHPQHVVIVILLPSDITRDFSDFFTHAKPRFMANDAGELQIDNLPVRRFREQPWLFRRSYAAAWMWGRLERWPEEMDLGQVMKTPQTILTRAAAHCAASGVTLTVATIVTPGTIELMQHDPAEIERNRFMVEALRQTGVKLIDLTGALRSAYEEQGDVLAAPVAHWSDAGNRLIALRLAEGLPIDRH